MTDTIAHLDLRQFRDGDAADRQAFTQALMSALKRHGFITLEGHLVDDALLEASYRTAEAFFAQDDAEKRRFAGALRGYTPFGVEHAKDHAAPDLKEFWQIGHETGGEHPNVWPDNPAAFHETFLTLFERLFETGDLLLQSIALGLDVPQDYFTPRIAGGTSLLRLLHYPPIPDGADPDCVRAAAHEDINLITLLVAAEGAGLELLDKDGRWLPVQNGRGHLIVDTGDMMARITNTVLPATTHRVVNPTGPNVSRYSMPFFVQPRSDVVLEVLESCRSDGAGAAPVTAGAFLNERLKAIGLPGA
jgi:isopenicillin N synthase-like dioxygenase